MPYAQTRTQDELNKAYAFVSNDSWQNGVAQLKDRLVEMGFEENEVPDSIQTRLPVPLGGSSEKKPLKLNVSKFDMSKFTEEEKKKIEVISTPIGDEVLINTDKIIPHEMEEKIIQATPAAERKAVSINLRVELRNQVVYERKYPFQENKDFKVPQLTLFIDDDWSPDCDEYFLDAAGKWLLDYPATLTEGEFRLKKEGAVYSIDIKGNSIVDRYLQETFALDLADTHTDWTIPKLAIWITQQIPDDMITQQVQVQFVRQLLEYLTINRGLSFNDLLRTKFILKDAIKEKINELKSQAEKSGMQRTLFSTDAKLKTDFSYSIDFAGKQYIPINTDSGTEFNKHYFPQVGKLNQEEAVCAKAIDQLDEVEYWVRNIEKHQYSFRLPKADGGFYPDFVAKLKDGRILAVEYKGEHLATNEDTKNKDLIGKLWEKSSNGKCLFLMAVKKNEIGTVNEQIKNKIKI